MTRTLGRAGSSASFIRFTMEAASGSAADAPALAADAEATRTRMAIVKFRTCLKIFVSLRLIIDVSHASFPMTPYSRYDFLTEADT
jgi:hypothetical protein